MKLFIRSMDVSQLVKRQMSIMLSTMLPKNNMPSKSTKLQFWYSRTEIDM